MTNDGEGPTYQAKNQGVSAWRSNTPFPIIIISTLVAFPAVVVVVSGVLFFYVDCGSG